MLLKSGSKLRFIFQLKTTPEIPNFANLKMLNFSSDGTFSCKRSIAWAVVYPSSAKQRENVSQYIYIYIYPHWKKFD